MFETDVLHPPELTPLPKGASPVWSFRSIIAGFSTDDLAGRVFSIFGLLICYLPSLLYRYSFKSTSWLYFPVVNLGTLPATFRTDEGRTTWFRRGTIAWERVRQALAVVTIALFVVAIVDPKAVANLIQASGAGETPVTMFSLMFVIDVGEIQSWHYFTLPSAVLTLFLLFWLDPLRREDALHKDHPEAAIDVNATRFWVAICAMQLRSTLVLIWMVLAFGYAIAFFHQQCGLVGLPGWALDFIAWAAGPADCPVPSAPPANS
jgi:hypothetical protein